MAHGPRADNDDSLDGHFESLPNFELELRWKMSWARILDGLDQFDRHRHCLAAAQTERRDPL